MGCGREVGNHHMTAAVGAITAGDHGSRIGRPHEGAAHGQPQEIRGAGSSLGQYCSVAAAKPYLAQEIHVWSWQGWQHRLRDTQRAHLTHFGQTLPCRLPGTTMPAGVHHARAVAKAQPAEVMRRADKAIELE